MKKTFTLIELIVVIAIIAILAAIITPNVFKAISKSKSALVVADFKNITSASMSFYDDTGFWPVNIDPAPDPDGANAWTWITIAHPLLSDSGNWPGWDGPYLEQPATSYSPQGSYGAECWNAGYYYTQWWNSTWAQGLYGAFNIDKDPGTGIPCPATGKPGCEVIDAWSINMFPIPADIRRGVNLAIDGDSLSEDPDGRVRVGDSCDGVINYYVSHPI